MRFVTDNISQGTGFSIDLEMIASPCGRNTYHLNSSLSSISLSSPMNGNLYMPNANCLWTLSTDEGKLIDIRFEQFDLEEDPHNKCTSDFLEIADEEVINIGSSSNILKFASKMNFYLSSSLDKNHHK